MDSLIQKISRRIKRLLKQFTISRNLKAKLNHNYHALSWLEKLVYRLFYRRKMPQVDRFFFEGELGLAGQMYIRDREGLYNTILQFKPRHCLEIGTWTGGGSTFFLAKAFEKNGMGKLWTLETDPELHRDAIQYYRRHLPTLAPYVEFKQGNDISVFREILENAGGLDCCFLDGAEDSTETINQYHFLQPYLRSGSILIAHDWHTDKMTSLQPLIKADPEWQLVSEIEPPESVGFVVYQHR